MKCVIYFSEKQQGSLNNLGFKNFGVFEIEFRTHQDFDLHFPILNEEEMNLISVLAIFPPNWKVTSGNLKKVMGLIEENYKDYDLIQFDYRFTLFQRCYERLPAIVRMRLLLKYFLRVSQALFVKPTVKPTFQKKLFKGYFLPNTRGYICSPLLVFETKSLKTSCLSTDRVLMSIARDSGFKVATVFPIRFDI